jgi:hypothetical protein
MTPRTNGRSAPANGRTFALERFAWGAPDRLELAGTFNGLDEAPAALPVLVLSGAERTHRLPAAADDVSGAPENGQPWHAAFVWQEAPAAFEAAVLQLGGELAVELPEPGAEGAATGNVELPVRSRPGAERLRLEAELLAAREELREAHRSEAELSRARDDLAAEREGRAGDAVRFREGLAQVRESAEEALALEQRTSEQLRDELKAAADALAAKEGELADVRGELEVAAAFRAETEAAKAEAQALKKRLDEAQRRIKAARGALGA